MADETCGDMIPLDFEEDKNPWIEATAGGDWHRAEAESCLRVAEASDLSAESRKLLVAKAQVHATLAHVPTHLRAQLYALAAAAEVVLADRGLEPTLDTEGFEDANLGELAYCVATVRNEL